MTFFSKGRFRKKAGSKYNAKPTNGFPSKLEAAVHMLLTIREKAGEISDIRRQQSVVLQEGPPTVRIAWKVDFSFIETKTGERVYAEAKGVETADYKLKLKLWRANPPATLEIYKGSYRRPTLALRIERKPDAAA